jgi:hypothetical protein
VEKAVRNLYEPGSQNTESRGRLAARLAAEREPPGNPDARGTSRTLGVDPTQHPRLGSMQYHETLPLTRRLEVARRGGRMGRRSERKTFPKPRRGRR